jgi:branched-chain amino acid transport system permease protein
MTEGPFGGGAYADAAPLTTAAAAPSPAPGHAPAEGADTGAAGPADGQVSAPAAATAAAPTAGGTTGTVAVAGPRRVRRSTRWVLGVVIAVVAIGTPFWVDGYWRSTFAFVLIAAIGALGLDVLTGWTGQISLGHAFFLASGAYVGGYLGGHLHWTAALWIPAAGAVAGVLGAITGPAALRLRGLYLAIVTIGLVYIGYYILETWTAFSGGPGGEALPPVTFGSWNFANGVTVAGHTFTKNQCYYYLALLLLVVGMLYVRNIGRSNLGRSMVAVRDRELAAAVIGVNVSRTKIQAFVISSVLAGVAGALYGSFLSFAVPGDWGLLLSIQYVVMIVVGGMASLWGPLLGALFVVGLPALLQNVSTTLTFLSNNGSISPGNASEIVFGVFLVLFLLVEPGGVVGVVRKITRALARRSGRTAVATGRGASDAAGTTA